MGTSFNCTHAGRKFYAGMGEKGTDKETYTNILKHKSVKKEEIQLNKQSPAANLQYPQDYLSIIRNGLGPASAAKKIIIIGAGMAGLTAASLLKRAGHEVIIIEANNRIGG